MILLPADTPKPVEQAYRAAGYFLPSRSIGKVTPLDKGHINDTFLVTSQTGECFILQRVNPLVFSDPQGVIKNMRLVTSHLHQQLDRSPKLRAKYTFPVLHHGPDDYGVHGEDGSVWRLMTHIPGRTFDTVADEAGAEELGRCLGIFHRLLSTLDPALLTDTLPGFHDTASYLAEYDRVRKESDQAGEPVLDFCARFIETHRHLASLLNDANGLSQRIIHGDPKIANFIFRENSDKVISLIDLDTVRFGLLLHDIGDGLRSCCNPQGESPPQNTDIVLVPELFHAWLRGYCSEAEMLLTRADKIHILPAIQVIAFELGVRFLTDHLQGNSYFRISYPGQNLTRAMVQFRLARSVEERQKHLDPLAMCNQPGEFEEE